MIIGICGTNSIECKKVADIIVAYYNYHKGGYIAKPLETDSKYIFRMLTTGPFPQKYYKIKYIKDLENKILDLLKCPTNTIEELFGSAHSTIFTKAMFNNSTDNVIIADVCTSESIKLIEDRGGIVIRVITESDSTDFDKICFKYNVISSDLNTLIDNVKLLIYEFDDNY